MEKVDGKTGAVQTYTGSTASANYAIAGGNGAAASGVNSIALGNGATASGEGATAIGDSASATAKYAVALGGSASGYQSLSIGPVSMASNQNSVAIGAVASATADNSVAIGTGAMAMDGEGSIAIGSLHAASNLSAPMVMGKSAVAIGSNSQALADYAVAINGGTANGKYSVAIGEDNTADGNNAIALGAHNESKNNNELALGLYNISTESDDVDKRTLTSLGIGTANNDRKNAQEIKFNGDYYIVGIGNYDGTNAGHVDANGNRDVFTLQEVLIQYEQVTAAALNDLNKKIKYLEAIIDNITTILP